MPTRFLRRALLLGLLLLAAAPAQAMAETYETPPDTFGGIPPSISNPSPPPAVTGTPQVGGTLTGTLGTWQSNVVKTSRWMRCNPAANVCVSTGDTNLSYAVTAADRGSVMMLRVQGRRPGLVPGSFRTRYADAVSNRIAAAPALPTAPRNVVAPKVTGDAREGRVVGVSPGQWTGTSPISYKYTWASCPATGACKAVGTGATYRVTRSDVGRRLLLAVGAKNAAGGAAAFAQSGVVVGQTSGLKRLSPFPTLLIDGRVAGSITRISTLRLRRVPGGSTITATCKGRGCPFRKSTVKVRRGKSRTVQLRRLQRRMRAGTTVVITVRKGNTIGKYIRLRFRSRSAPARVDRCVVPKSSKPVKCT